MQNKALSDGQFSHAVCAAINNAYLKGVADAKAPERHDLTASQWQARARKVTGDAVQRIFKVGGSNNG